MYLSDSAEDRVAGAALPFLTSSTPDSREFCGLLWSVEEEEDDDDGVRIYRERVVFLAWYLW